MINEEQIVVVGRFGSPHGIKGMVKVFSFTKPSENILQYQPWLVKKGRTWQTMTFKHAENRSKFIVVNMDGYLDRTSCEELTNCEIGVNRQQLPELEDNEFYWKDLEGLEVENKQQEHLGKVSHLFETGSNDVLVVEGGKKRYLIPFLMNEVVIEVDIKNAKIIVDWDPEF